DGQQSLMPLKFELLQTDSIIAYLPVEIPEPYVPQKPQTPKRQEFHKVIDLHVPSEWGPQFMAVNGKPTLREVLPGDVDPDAARKAREYADRYRSEHTEQGYRDACRHILDILNEGNQ